MPLTPIAIAAFILASTACAAAGPAQLSPPVDIAPVWAGHPVGFTLLTRGQHQFVAFYDRERHLTVAARTLDSTTWDFARLPEQVGWDSHNSIVLTADDDGFLHLAGNMHVHPLKYFRTTKPLDVHSFEKLAMVGRDEAHCTYPRFFRGPREELIFTYRDGRSGNGNQIYNVYDPRNRAWRRLLDQPLTDGKGKMNAYFDGPRGPDGFFHLAWVWCDTPDCATNHDLSYARSRDLVHWEDSHGKALALPLTAATGEVVDPVPAGGGMINSNIRLGFDAQGRVVLTYHKFDAKGFTQLYNARLEEGRWRIVQASNWDYRWAFSGGGTIVAEIRVGAVCVASDGRLVQSYQHPRADSGNWELDPVTLRVRGPATLPATTPAELGKVESTFPGMQVRWADDAGASPEKGVRYRLRWETLPANRDKPRAGPLPEPTMLRVYKLRD